MLAPISLSVLLASVLFTPAEAVPHPRNVGLVTLPLTRLHKARDDVHPQIFLQQHANRAHRRLARMTGKREPTAEEMRAAIEKRRYTVGKVDSELTRVRGGANPKVNVAAAGNGNGVIVTTITTTVTAAQAQETSAKSTVTQFVTVTGTPAPSAPAEAANATDTATAPTATATAGTGSGNGTASTGSNASGFSQADLTAALQGGLTPANTPTANNSLGLDDEANDVGYIATVQIGTPPRDFKMLMDSGSADMWVGGEACKSQAGGGCGNHTFLGTQSSSTFKDLGKPFQVTYGTGQVAGDIVTDDVLIAGLALPTHTFGAAAAESTDFADNSVPFDGLVGLAQSTLSNQKVPTPPESLAAAGLIQSAITSYKISRLADGKNDGEITFGGIDTTKIDSSTLTTITNVNKQGFWEVPFTASVGGKDLGLAGRTAILDTGTSLIIAPPADALALHKQIPGAKSDGQGGFTIPCTTSTIVTFTMGKQDFAIDPRDLTFVPVDQNNLQGDCVSGIMSGQIGGAQEWLVGDVFLKNAYFSHDVGKNAITLAKLV